MAFQPVPRTWLHDITSVNTVDDDFEQIKSDLAARTFIYKIKIKDEATGKTYLCSASKTSTRKRGHNPVNCNITFGHKNSKVVRFEDPALDARSRSPPGLVIIEVRKQQPEPAAVQKKILALKFKEAHSEHMAETNKKFTKTEATNVRLGIRMSYGLD
eukprot:150137_1